MGITTTTDEIVQDSGVLLTEAGELSGVQTLIVDLLCLSALNTAPSSSSDTGTTGEIRITATHIYVCTATDTWVRTALTTW